MTTEAQVRDPCVVYAVGKGVLHKRMHFGAGAARGWPDDLFIFPNGHHWWVEFKRPGGNATRLQKYRHTQMRANKSDVGVYDDKITFQYALCDRLSKCA